MLFCNALILPQTVIVEFTQIHTKLNQASINVLIKSFQFHLLTLAKHEQKIFPNYITTRVGKTVKFTCRTSNPLQWKFERNMPNNVKIHKNVLRIQGVQNFNEGKYSCHGTNKDKSYFEDWASLIVMNG